MTIEVLAEKNLACVRTFLQTASAEEGRALFAPGAVVEYQTAQRVPLSVDASAWPAQGAWRFENVRVYTGDDPNTILAEADKVTADGTEYLIVEFLLEEGGIRRYREIPNPTMSLHR